MSQPPPLADNLPLNPSQNPAAVPSIPRLLYGTAWKQGRTTPLVLAALRSGFRGVDTAAQPLHYREDLVGAALQQHLASPSAAASAATSGPVPREPIFVQTNEFVGGVADAARVSREVVFYGLVLALGACVLDGTTREEEMRADLEGIETLSRWADGDGRELWEVAVRAFKKKVGDEV
ncbi:hypothetical protein VdG1_06669 [Verticillium dahliae VDG1]|nr:hypothetical protein VdG1_06669 [Verticillium dahliae VDG1]